ncbi:F0F1 ATP synthase subunit B [Cupriavidus basilensis]|uniref:ATP synthase subunit b n=1 Tax=Cupriavidus basilensis TaxID=68895 RepID=A0A643FN77_9BURK|nr:F0F1 ATP synthase subunit B [Cupriavidus basilensis]MDR3382118.1 F0F1 ATP synthase subunit B [Cupriavidus basilensis]QOT78099.1 F0F1 ATP synthase subunit B [Cupriavidus basilensis]
MLIDWFTVGAQALNFVILVWLLKRFLYQPVLDAIDAREGRIARQIADASAKEAEARKQGEAFQQKTDAFERERAALLAQAAGDAETQRQQWLEAARQAADALAAKRQDALRSEAGQLTQALGDLARREVFAVARRALADLASASLEERVADVFIRRLRALDEPARASLAAAFRQPAAHAVVRSAFALPAAQCAAIQAAVDDVLGTAIPLQFDTAQGLVSGIELIVGGQKLAWSIDGYLGSLEHAVSALLSPESAAMHAGPEPESAPPPAAKPVPKPEASQP